jgi:hypothetical protein
MGSGGRRGRRHGGRCAWPNTRLKLKRGQQATRKPLMNKLLREDVLLGIGWTVVPWSIILAILIWTFFH